MVKTHQVLRNFRKSKGISCADLAKQLGVQEVTLRSYENGHRRISAERALEFEAKTGGAISRRDLCPHIFGKVAA